MLLANGQSLLTNPAKLFVALLVATLASGCTDSAEQSAAPVEAATPSATPPPTEETLLLQAPPGWLRIEEQASEAFRLAEYVPAGQDKDDWNDRLFIEANALKPLPDPITFLETMGEELKAGCTTSDHNNIHSGLENGYPTSVRLLICAKSNITARSEVSIIKAIQGEDFFYVVSRARRSDALQTEEAPLSNKEMAEWSLYMRSIKVCDPRSENHPCPAATLSAESAG